MSMLVQELMGGVATTLEAIRAKSPALSDMVGLPQPAYTRLEALHHWTRTTDRPTRPVRAAFARLTADPDSEAQRQGALLLADIRDTFETAGTDRLPSARLAEELGKLEDRPWADHAARGRAKRATCLFHQSLSCGQPGARV